MRDVAALARVSAKTVSRVFNGDPHVSPETKERVEAALQELRYVPNSIATTFRRGRAPVIGVAVPDVVDPFFAAIARAADALAKSRGMSVVITSIGEDPLREPDVVRGLVSQALSGLVIAPVAHDHGYLRAWSDRMPIVFVDRQPVRVTADSFTEDDASGGDLATSHLIDHGHRRICFLGDDPLVPTTVSRLDGYRSALVSAGIDPDDSLVAFGAGRADGVDGAYLEVLKYRPSAVFCADARSAIKLVPRLRRSGLAVTGYGDFPLADMLSPALTVIDQDPQRMGTLAAQRVLDRIDRPRGRFRRRTILPVRLLERESCMTGLSNRG